MKRRKEMERYKMEMIAEETTNWTEKEMVDYIDSCDSWDSEHCPELIEWLCERHGISMTEEWGDVKDIDHLWIEITEAVKADRREG
jgi:hypothetical protein